LGIHRQKSQIAGPTESTFKKSVNINSLNFLGWKNAVHLLVFHGSLAFWFLSCLQHPSRHLQSKNGVSTYDARTWLKSSKRVVKKMAAGWKGKLFILDSVMVA